MHVLNPQCSNQSFQNIYSIQKTAELTDTLDKGVLDGVVWLKEEAGMTVENEII